MGQGSSRVLEGGTLRRAAFAFARWSITDVKVLLDSLKRIGTFVMLQTQFCAWISSVWPEVQEQELNQVFELMDTGANGRVNCLEFLAGLVMLSEEDFSTKTQFCFELYDFNLNGSLSPDELVLMVRSTVLGTFKLVELSPLGEERRGELERDQVFENVAEQAIRVYDLDGGKSLSFLEFVSWARGSRDVMSFVDSCNLFARAAAEEEVERRAQRESENLMGGGGDEAENPAFEETSYGDEAFHREDEQDSAALQYAAMCKNSSESAAAGGKIFNGHLEIDWVYGYSGRKGLDNAKYLDGKRGRIVYPAGSSVIILDTEKTTQVVYSGHSDNVVAVEVHPNGRTLATADASGEVHVWDWDLVSTGARSTNSSVILKGVAGQVLLSFSESGSLLAVGSTRSSGGVDKERSSFINVWDWAAKERIVDPINISCERIEALSWAADDDVLGACGACFLKTYAFQAADAFKRRYSSDQSDAARKFRRFIESDIALVTESAGKVPQFTSVCFLAKNIVAGTSDGELFMFERASGNLVLTLQAHSEKHAVRCLSEWAKGLVSGGDDGELRLWDMGLHPINGGDGGGNSSEAVESSWRHNEHRHDSDSGKSRREFNNSIQLTFASDSLGLADSRVTSLCIASRTTSRVALVGLSSGEIFELNLDEKTGNRSRSKICWVEGHALGAAGSIAAHPRTCHLFATCSESDLSVRLWDSRSKRQVGACLLEAPGACLAFSPQGDYLAIGLSNGKVSIRNPQELAKEVLAVLSPENEQDRELRQQRGIVSLSFSPDGGSLAVCCLSGACYLFAVRRQSQIKQKSFTCLKVLKPSGLTESFGPSIGAAVLDWSMDSTLLKVTVQSISCKTEGYAGCVTQHYVWAVSDGGNLVEGDNERLRRVRWASLTFPDKWALKGLPQTALGAATCFDTVIDKQNSLLAFGDTKGRVSVARYPCEERILSSQLRHYSSEKLVKRVSTLRFVDGQEKLVASCSSDSHFVQWRLVTDDEPWSPDAQSRNQDSNASRSSERSDDYDSEIEEEVFARRGRSEQEDPFQLLAGGGYGDESIPGQSWQCEFSPPSAEHESNLRAMREITGIDRKSSEPDLSLTWVQGLGAFATKSRPFLGYLSERTLCYPAAGLIVVADLVTSDRGNGVQQRYMQRHSGAPDTMAYSPSRGYVASSQGGKILVWESQTLNVVSTIQLPWSKEGGSCAFLAFSTDGELLVAVGNDSNQTVAVFDWRKERLQGLTPGGAQPVLDVCWTGPKEFVSVGPNSVTFWRTNPAGEGPPESRRGLFRRKAASINLDDPEVSVPAQSAYCVCLIQPAVGEYAATVAVGLADGTYALWDCASRTPVAHLPLAKENSSASPAFCMRASPLHPGSFFAGHKDGSVYAVSLEKAARDASKASALLARPASLGSPAGAFKIQSLGSLSRAKSSIRGIDVISRSPTRSATSGRMENGVSLSVATRAGQVIEVHLKEDAEAKGFAVGSKATLAQGHAAGEIWGLASCPGSEPFVATAGDDGWLYVWDIENRRLLGSHSFDPKEHQIKSLAIGPAREATPGLVGVVSIGFTSGQVALYSLAREEDQSSSSLPLQLTELVMSEPLLSLDGSRNWVHCLRVSPTGAFVAAGCHDGSVLLLNPTTLEILHTLTGHSAPVVAIDFSRPQESTGREFMQSCSSNGELCRWNATSGIRFNTPKALSDCEWESWSCLSGWQVGGLETGSSCCSAAQGGTAMIRGGKDGSLTLVPFPLPQESSSADGGNRRRFANQKRSKLHAGMVTRVEFACGDQYVVSSGSDGCFCVWKTQGLEKIASAVRSWYGRSVEDRMRESDLYRERSRKQTSWDSSRAKAMSDAPQSPSASVKPSIKADTDVSDGVDSEQPSLPWAVDSTSWRLSVPKASAGSGSSSTSAPRRSTQLEWVYGCSADRVGAHLAGPHDDIIFAARNVIVVQKPVREGRVAKQSFFLEHGGAVCCISVSQDGRLVASGDTLGHVFVWDASTLVTCCKIETKAKVTHVSLSAGNKFIGVVEADGGFSVRRVSDGKTLAYSRDSSLANGGPSVRSLVLMPQNESSDAVSNIDIASLTDEGNLVVWSLDHVRSRLTWRVSWSDTPATCLCETSSGGGIVTGHKDGSVLLWTWEAEPISSLSVRRSLQAAELKADQCPGFVSLGGNTPGAIRQLLPRRDRSVLCIYEGGVAVVTDARFDPVPSLSFTLPKGCSFVACDKLTGGSRLLFSLSNGTLCEADAGQAAGSRYGLYHPAVIQCGHANELPPSSFVLDPLAGNVISFAFEAGLNSYCVTAGGNKVCHLWDMESHRLIETKPLPDAASAVTVSPSGHHIAVGTKGGSLVVFSGLLSREILRVNVSFSDSGNHEKDAIRCLAYSPDGSKIAVGCDDSKLRVFETRNYALTYVVPNVHAGPVTHVDWSASSDAIRSNSCLEAVPVVDVLKFLPRPRANEYRFHDAVAHQKGVQEPEVKWASASCPMGEHSLDKKIPGTIVSSTSFGGSSFAFVLSSGRIISEQGSVLTKVSHRGAATVQSTASLKTCITTGLYDGIVFQFKLK